MKNATLIIIPTFNEKENVELMINTLFNISKTNYDILISDENSLDGTAKIVSHLQKKYPNILQLLQGRSKQGIGTAYIAGFRHALENKYKKVMQMDCDFSIGSRYIKDVGFKNWALKNVLISKAASIYTQFILNLPIKDPTAGFSVIKTSVLKELLNKNSLKLCKDYGFQIVLKYLAYKKRFSLYEFPIIFTNRTKDHSKFSILIFLEALLKVPLIRFYV